MRPVVGAGLRIVHVDMDAFYAAVEQRDDPALRGRPVVVGGTPEGRGVVATASYEARAFGIHSAMSAAQARRLCPQAVFLAPDMARYRAVSRQIQAVFREATDRVEPISLDEAYLDVTHNHLGLRSAGDVARWVRARIMEETRLTASAGVGPSKLVAKIASDMRKPNGLLIVPPAEVQGFLAPLPVRKLWSVGPATARLLAAHGFQVVADLARADPARLERLLGKQGRFLAGLSRGEDPRGVVTHREPKSRSAETTFAEDVLDLDLLVEVVHRHAARVAGGIERWGRPARTVILKVRYGDFTTVTRSGRMDVPSASGARIAATAEHLLRERTEAGRRPIRLVGVGVSGFEASGSRQLELFEGHAAAGATGGYGT